MQNDQPDAAPPHETVPEEELWADKRARQATDIQAIKEGKVTQAQMSWFSGGRAKRLKAIGSPF